MLRRALADGVRWPGLFIAVNVSPVQMRDPWLVDLVGAVMAETGIAAARVVLEVTEGILIDNPQEAQTRLEALRALGVRIALDDFGTGYSSLSYLQKFPFDRLKIDRAFVSSLGTTANSGTIIQSIVALGHALGMSVLAEGSKPTSSACCSVSPAATRCRVFCSRGRGRRRRSTRCWRVGAGRGRARRWRAEASAVSPKPHA